MSMLTCFLYMELYIRYHLIALAIFFLMKSICQCKKQMSGKINADVRKYLRIIYSCCC